MFLNTSWLDQNLSKTVFKTVNSISSNYMVWETRYYPISKIKFPQILKLTDKSSHGLLIIVNWSVNWYGIRLRSAQHLHFLPYPIAREPNIADCKSRNWFAQWCCTFGALHLSTVLNFSSANLNEFVIGSRAPHSTQWHNTVVVEPQFKNLTGAVSAQLRMQ